MIIISIVDIAAAFGQFLVIVSSLAIMLPNIRESLPPTSCGIAYDPSAGINVNSVAVIIPGFIFGIKTLK